MSYPFINQTTVVNQSRTVDESEILVNNEKPDVDDNFAAPNANSTTITEHKQFVGMTYVAGLSEKLSKMITRTVPNLKIAPRPVSKIGEIFRHEKKTDR